MSLVIASTSLVIRTMLLAAHIVGAMTRTFEELASTIKIASEQGARPSPTRNPPNYKFRKMYACVF
jgi:archaellum component FlaG (FlaF/FlaG flagellin family)